MIYHYDVNNLFCRISQWLGYPYSLYYYYISRVFYSDGMQWQYCIKELPSKRTNWFLKTALKSLSWSPYLGVFLRNGTFFRIGDVVNDPTVFMNVRLNQTAWSIFGTIVMNRVAHVLFLKCIKRPWNSRHQKASLKITWPDWKLACNRNLVPRMIPDCKTGLL